MYWSHEEYMHNWGAFEEAIREYGEEAVRQWMANLDDEGNAERDVFGDSGSEDSSEEFNEY